MIRHLIEARSLCDWQSRLGNTEKHWKRFASAMEMAIAWSLASAKEESGLPGAVQEMLKAIPGAAEGRVKIAIPELRTPLPGGGTSSQTDLWVLLSAPVGFISLSVEGKAREPFDDRTSAWLNKDRSEGKEIRLAYLCKELGISADEAFPLRYQLIHRTVSALIEAREWHATAAVMLVQRFAKDPDKPADSWEDFSTFVTRLGVAAERGRFAQARVPGDMPLWVGWLDSRVATDDEFTSVFGQSLASLRGQFAR